jgi:hypothetical protein
MAGRAVKPEPQDPDPWVGDTPSTQLEGASKVIKKTVSPDC